MRYNHGDVIMRRWISERLAAVAILVLMVVAPAARAQHRVGPIYPESGSPSYSQNRQLQSGEDPFRYNPHTGRFDYVPIPYEYQAPGPNYNPFRLNRYSGRFDYVPWGPRFDYNDWARRGNTADWGNASNRIDTRVDPRRSSGTSIPRPSRSSDEPPEIETTAPMPPPAMPMLIPEPTTRRATTGPSTTSAGTAPATRPAAPEGWMNVRPLAGRWEYNYATGQWIFVLPPD